MKQRSLLALIISAMYEENWVEPNLNPILCFFHVLCIIEKQSPNNVQFKSTLLDLHALLQVYVISLAYLNNV